MRKSLLSCLAAVVACLLSALSSEANAQTIERRQLVVVGENNDSTKYYTDELEYAIIDSTVTTTPVYKFVSLKRKSGADIRIYLSDINKIVFRKVSENIEPVSAEPKVGDYYYSDGTWSDGGLISIDPEGTNPVWAEVKPAPIAGKTVIGIVAMTNPERMAQADKDAGFTHGYVISSKFVHDPNNKNTVTGEPFKTTKFTWDEEFECNIRVCKSGITWYDDLDGRTHCNNIVEYYGSMLVAQCPTVYYTNIMNHPATSSEWFIPSTGQMWDALANLCGHKVAMQMKGWRTNENDATYNCTAYVYDDPMEIFNSTLSQVDDNDKELLEVDDDYHNYCSLWTSTRYDEDAMDIFEVGKKHTEGVYKNKGLIECMAAWYNGDCYARPMLAF